MAPAQRSLVLVKLGGSLLTDKTRPRALRRDQVARLARELATARAEGGPAVVLGHGSGSFGHWAATRHRFRERHGLARTLAAARVQLAAGELHRRILSALIAAGLPALSQRPAAWLTLAGEAIATARLEGLVGVLEAGGVPVVCGDVVADSSLGTTIASTELVFEALVAQLPHHGWKVERVLWLGQTAGILDGQGEVVPVLDLATRSSLDSALVGAAGVDVTGGVRLRVDAALRLADRGVESLILDGRVRGALSGALVGRGGVGTRVPASRRED